jgi:hypothetical protein
MLISLIKEHEITPAHYDLTIKGLEEVFAESERIHSEAKAGAASGTLPRCRLHQP